jgi:methylated-DNA-[protein]-cysteine S-methyltransferase
MFIAEYPKICVALNFQHARFKSSSLSFANSFECRIEGEADATVVERLVEFLKNYASKTPGKIDLNLDSLTPFRKQALRCLQEVAFGEVVSYGELAAKAGQPKAARAVGTACHFNPYPLFIPCHRVIAAGGRLGGFAQELRLKKLLLDFEIVKMNY